jgi:hypothetical protein
VVKPLCGSSLIWLVEVSLQFNRHRLLTLSLRERTGCYRPDHIKKRELRQTGLRPLGRRTKS